MKGESKILLKNTLIYAIGNFGSKILAFLLLPLYSFYLTKSEFGTYDVFIVTISLLAPLLTIQISDATYRWLLEKKQDIKYQSKVISSGLTVILLLSSVFYFSFFIILYFYFNFKYSGYFSILLFLNLLLPFFQKTLRGIGDNMTYAISGIIFTFLILTLNLLFLSSFNLKVESLFIASIISNIIVLIYILYKIKFIRIINLKRVDLVLIKEMIIYSLPLVPNSISWWLINASDKYLILLFINIEANGIYAISTRFPSILMLLNSIFIMAWQDYGISASGKEKNTIYFSKIFNDFIVLVLTSVIVLISLSPFLIKYLINSKFYEAWKYLPLLFIGTAFSAFSAYLGVLYQREKKTKELLTTSLIGGMINVIISFSLINKIGLFAPALGTFISFLAIYIIRKMQTKKFFQLEVNNFNLIGLTFISLIFTFLLYQENIYINVLLITSSLIIFIYFNKLLINSLFSLLKIKVLKHIGHEK